MDLQLLWFGLLGVLRTGSNAILDGFDLGVGKKSGTRASFETIGEAEYITMHSQAWIKKPSDSW